MSIEFFLSMYFISFVYLQLQMDYDGIQHQKKFQLKMAR